MPIEIVLGARQIGGERDRGQSAVVGMGELSGPDTIAPVMVTAAIIALVFIAWYSLKTYQEHGRAKLLQAQKRQFDLTHWKKEEEHGDSYVERVLSYADMQLTVTVRVSDGGYLGDMWSRQHESWQKNEEQLREEGWTKDEWESRATDHLKKFEIRRQNDGTWQGRLIFRYWQADVREALESNRSFENEKVKELTGLTKDEWEQRGDYYNDEFRPWTTITADAPAIEAGYQRFIHNA